MKRGEAWRAKGEGEREDQGKIEQGKSGRGKGERGPKRYRGRGFNLYREK